MHWWHLITAFEVSLALILTVRVFVLGIRSVRPMLLFLLVPRILAPISFALLPNVTDYRKVWIVFAAIQWACHIGIVYAFISAAFYSFDGLLIILRKGWTLALLTGFVLALIQTYLSNSFGSLMMKAFDMDRAVATLVEFALMMLVAIVLYCRVRIPRNVLKVGIGTALILAVRAIGQFAGIWGYDVDVVRWTHEFDTVLWIGCLTYWSLFLSSKDEVDNRTLIARI